MITLHSHHIITEDELQYDAIRAQGSGGQHINKVSSAIHLRFNVKKSSLPLALQSKILAYQDQRISHQGFIIIKAQRFRTQEQNRHDATERLRQLLNQILHEPKQRIATKPTKASKTRRVDSKTKQGQIKQQRKKVIFD